MTETQGLIQGWFDVAEVEPGVFRIDEPLHFEWVKSYLVVGSERAVLIDSGSGVGNIRYVVEKCTNLPLTLVNSHSHWDHIGGNHFFKDIAIHGAEAAHLERGVSAERMKRNLAPYLLEGPLPPGVDSNNAQIPPSKATTVLQGGETIDLGGVELDIIHAPGHSPGGIVLVDRARGLLFSTDVAYMAALYCYAEGTNFDEYRVSMRRLAGLAPTIRSVYGSHNETPFAPEKLIAIDRAFDSVAAGEVAPTVQANLHVFEFGKFSLILP